MNTTPFKAKTDLFTYKKGVFYAEASQLGWKPGEAPRIILLTNPKTGNTVGYSLLTKTEDLEAIQGWTYGPGKKSLEKHPKAIGTRVLVMND